MPQGVRAKTIARVSLATSLFIGLHYCFIMPPWEGGDEYAHYSYAEQLAFTGKIPTRENAHISNRLYQYANHAPVRYFEDADAEGVGHAPTYKEFFAQPENLRHEAGDFVHGRDWSNVQYKASAYLNWQAQHPPLYYALCAALIRMTKSFTYAGHLATLRIFSYLLAWIGLALPLFVFYQKRASNDLRSDTLLGVVILPMLCIAWYPAMARIGNDSLCVLLSSIAFLSLLGPLTRHKAALAGVALGLGALTKGYFVAISPAIVIWLVLRALKCKDDRNRLVFLRSSAIILLTVLAVSGWWYIRNAVVTGSLLGSFVEGGDISILHRLKTVLIDKFDLKGMAKSGIGLFVGVVTPTTASQVRPATLFVLPAVVFLSAIGGGWFCRYHRRSITEEIWLAPVFIAAMVVGILYHLLLFVYLMGAWGYGTGGSYVLVVGLAMAAFLGGGFWHLVSHHLTRVLSNFTLIYTFALSIWVFWAQMLLYAGIAVPTSEKSIYSFPSGIPPGLGIPEAINRLQYISYPRTALLFLVTGIICWGYGLYRIVTLKTKQFSPGPEFQRSE